MFTKAKLGHRKSAKYGLDVLIQQASFLKILSKKKNVKNKNELFLNSQMLTGFKCFKSEKKNYA